MARSRGNCSIRRATARWSVKRVTSLEQTVEYTFKLAHERIGGWTTRWPTVLTIAATASAQHEVAVGPIRALNLIWLVTKAKIPWAGVFHARLRAIEGFAYCSVRARFAIQATALNIVEAWLTSAVTH